jgi:colicin import membrane protein
MTINNALLALANVKGAASAAAAAAMTTDVAMFVGHGNRRNLDDTAAALRDAGAVTKGGEYAANKKGRMLRAFLDTAAAAALVRDEHLAAFPLVKGKAPTAEAKQAASAAAAALVDSFFVAVETAEAEAAAARKAAPKKAEAAKEEEAAPEKAEAAAEAAAKEEAAALSSAVMAAVLAAIQTHGETAVLAALAGIKAA